MFAAIAVLCSYASACLSTLSASFTIIPASASVLSACADFIDDSELVTLFADHPPLNIVHIVYTPNTSIAIIARLWNVFTKVNNIETPLFPSALNNGTCPDASHNNENNIVNANNNPNNGRP